MHILSRELKKARRKNPEIVKGIINTTRPERVTVLSSQGFFMRLHIPTFSGKKKSRKDIHHGFKERILPMAVPGGFKSHSVYSLISTNSALLCYVISEE